MAKAPVTGEVKTRLGADVGLRVAADLAAAALLDTLEVVSSCFPDAPLRLSMAGDLAGAERGAELRDALTGWTVVPQVGDGFGARLAHAHAEVDGPVLQIGMDTPHLEPALLREAADGLDRADGVLGPAEDGGWWLLGLCDPARAGVLADVPMSSERTGELTLAALTRPSGSSGSSGLDITTISQTYDVDTVAEAARAASDAPHTRFAAAWRALERPDQ